MKYYDITDKDGVYISFTDKDKADKWIDKHKKEYEEINIFGLHVVESERLTVSERCDKAFAIANNAIYFNDRSDYLSALWDVCMMLNPQISEDEVGKKYLEE